MGVFDSRTVLVNDTKEAIAIRLSPPVLLSAGKSRSLRTSEVRKMNTVRGPHWRVPVVIEGGPHGMTLSPREHLLGMSVVVFTCQKEGEDGSHTIVARGVEETLFDRLFDGWITIRWKKRSLVDIDLHEKPEDRFVGAMD